MYDRILRDDLRKKMLTCEHADGILRILHRASGAPTDRVDLRPLGLTKLDFLSAWQKDLANAGWTAALSSAVDILLVAAAIYWLMMLSRRRGAWPVIWGLLIFLALIFITDKLQLQTLNFLLRSFLPLGPVAIFILFYPELRYALENMGKVAGWGSEISGLAKKDVTTLVDIVVRATLRMSERQIGALIVLQRQNALDDVIATGVKLDAAVTEELIGSIFNPGGPLHDGAVVIRGNRIIAAACTLPLSESAHVGTMIHTRHKAALGVVEESDAAVVVVSEETGTISLAVEGKLYRELDETALTVWLKDVLGISEEENHAGKGKKVPGTLRNARIRRR